MVEAFVQRSTSVLFSFLSLSMCFHLPGRNELRPHFVLCKASMDPPKPDWPQISNTHGAQRISVEQSGLLLYYNSASFAAHQQLL